MEAESNKVEDDVINNSKIEHLYNHDFGGGRFFQVVFSDNNETHIKLASKTLMKITYLKESDDIEGIEIVKAISGNEKERIKFSKFNLQQLTCFLDFIKNIDLKSISDRRITLADDSLNNIDSKTKKQITTLLSGTEGLDVIKDSLDSGLITSQDLVNTGYRKQQLKIFEKLLNNKEYIVIYKTEFCNPKTKDETAWQHFFNKNQWIFGYGLDYRFQGILQKEFHASGTTASGSNGVIGDFLTGDNNFTSFVELKLPTTQLFGKDKNRANVWKLSNDLLEAFSQILEQKASGQLKIETSKELNNDKSTPITQRAYDSKTILIIGNWSEINKSPEPEGIKSIKKKTFELFRRDSRNIEILTYDELYDRAKFIVENKNNE
ncbi:DUF4263 domain-containing protein [Flavobacterium arcticum]|uniref:DUF4263 domain-containing protein n=1 Tax=Flavobacterium arcticum TaxID=1784713 RepID=A0A345HD76_9FLAO|nr:Shedu immune nuclease family protein [Flavobacterium arcticum]AXG74536.1 DUF4263 domain-containing protein [Flavobacterium arcticum]KAF2512344.1 DUF4263 domain-containing protein [Flavobacterium arcticum]